ncbi:MAG: hypothetical protein H7A25_07745 [Leptospiraceae bacterium]|nr:hypothetical protein [Leptospiraceae bacterium]
MNRKKIKEKSRTLPVSHAGMGKPKPILSIINEYKSSVFVNIEDEWQQVNLNFEDSYQGFLKKLEERIKRLQNERK